MFGSLFLIDGWIWLVFCCIVYSVISINLCNIVYYVVWIDPVLTTPDVGTHRCLTNSNNSLNDQVELEVAAGAEVYHYTVVYKDASLKFSSAGSSSFEIINAKAPVEINPKLDKGVLKQIAKQELR